MEALAALVGIGVAAAAPFVPGLRPVAKAVVKSGLAMAGATMTVATVIVEEVSDLAAHLRSDQDAPAGTDDPEADEMAQAAGPEATASDGAAEATAAAADSAASSSATGAAAAGLRPAAKAAVKGGIALAGVAKGAAAAAAGQVGALAASVRPEKPSQSSEAAAAADPTAASQADAPAPSLDAAPAPDDLTRVAGVGPKIATMLQEAGITTFAQLAVTPVETLQAVLDQGGPRFRIIDPSGWPAQGQALHDAPPPAPKPFDNTDLVQIDGIGPKIAQLLKDHGIATVDQLAAASVEDLHAILVQAGPRFRIADPSAWPGQAQALLATARS